MCEDESQIPTGPKDILFHKQQKVIFSQSGKNYKIINPVI